MEGPNSLVGHPGAEPSGFPLLRLPPEVRNMIYELVLTHDKPLHCAVDEEAEYRTNDDDDAELDPDLGPWPKPFMMTTDIRGKTEFNQLKYVCRQLWAETAGIEIQFNTITFYSHPFTDHRDHFPWGLSWFWKKLALSKIMWLKDVMIKPDCSDSGSSHRHDPAIAFYDKHESDLQLLRNICVWLPHLKVRLRLPCWNPVAEYSCDFIRTGLIAAYVFQGVGYRPEILQTAEALDQEPDRYLTSTIDDLSAMFKRKDVPNLLIIPLEPSGLWSDWASWEFDEDEWRSWLQHELQDLDSSPESQESSPMTRDVESNMEEYLELVEEWLENGITCSQETADDIETEDDIETADDSETEDDI